MASLRMRYYVQLNGNRLLVPQILLNIGRISTYLNKVLLQLKVYVRNCFVQAILKLLITVWKFTDILKIVNHLIFYS